MRGSSLGTREDARMSLIMRGLGSDLYNILGSLGRWKITNCEAGLMEGSF
jgi:hypothetical protein